MLSKTNFVTAKFGQVQVSDLKIRGAIGFEHRHVCLLVNCSENWRERHEASLVRRLPIVPEEGGFFTIRRIGTGMVPLGYLKRLR
ncbi:unannotated protein [freshwater metagenome]|uniref:Unannotated protein n=1 Tax=freshwater metagenome TaxID=449393 RepID=A0A6J7SJ82_9ZZZZ